MRVSGWKSISVTAAAILGIALALSAAARPPRVNIGQAAAAAKIVAGEMSLSVDPAQSKVHWMVDSTLHTVHGTFALKGGGLHFEAGSGTAGGEIVVLATSGESGNSSRDERMQKEVLETGKYPEAVFRPTQIEGRVATSGRSDVTVHGTLLLHGGSHEIVVPVHAEISGDGWKGTGKFDVPYIQWGLKNPSNILLKVQPVVNVQLEMVGTVKASK